MDGQKFDSLARTLAKSGSRRTAVKGILASIAGIAVGVKVAPQSALAIECEPPCGEGATCNTDVGYCCASDHPSCGTLGCCPVCTVCEGGACVPSSGYACWDDGTGFCCDGDCVVGATACCVDAGQECGGNDDCCSGFCCDGICCDSINQTCCDGACCTGQCLDDVCCESATSFGCGSECCPNADTCCDDGCCTGQCDQAGACCESSASFICDGECCPNASNCCQVDGCCAGSCNSAGECCATESSFSCGASCCDNDTEKCCGGVCIPAGNCCPDYPEDCPDAVCNPTAGYCCATDHQVCGPVCCDACEVCADGTCVPGKFGEDCWTPENNYAETGTCCAGVCQLTDGECCVEPTSSQWCSEDQCNEIGWCCADDKVPCGETCCGPCQICADAATSTCGPDLTQDDDYCWLDGEGTCCNGTCQTNDGECCVSPDSSQWCTEGQCNQYGYCCADDRIPCGQACCGPCELCLNADTSTCGVDPALDDTFCSDPENNWANGTCCNGTCHSDDGECCGAKTDGQWCSEDQCNAIGWCCADDRIPCGEFCCGPCESCNATTLTCEVDTSLNNTSCNYPAEPWTPGICCDGYCDTVHETCPEEVECKTDGECGKDNCCCDDGSCSPDCCVKEPVCKSSDDCEKGTCCCHNGACSDHCCHHHHKPEKPGKAEEPVTELPVTGSGSNGGGSSLITGAAILGGAAAVLGVKLKKDAQEREQQSTEI